MNPSSRRYWRFIANYHQYGGVWINWDEMHREGFAAIGWREIGSLSHITKDEDGRKALQSLMRKYNDRGRWANEIFAFVSGIEIGDVILATRKETILGCGIVEGDYYHVEDTDIPHRRKVRWFDSDEWSLPVEEGKGRAVGELKKEENLVSIEERMPPKTISEEDDAESAKVGLPDVPLNRILYGVPGSGKTFSVQRRAVEIVAPAEFSSETPDEEIGRLFREYVRRGRIEFVTFHQSYSYEEFVEGFRYDPATQVPVLNRGIFQTFSERAMNPGFENALSEGARVWKVSLGDGDQGHIFERCIESGEISIGWLEDEDLTGFAGNQSGWGGEPKLFEEDLRLLFEKNHPGGSPNSVLDFVSRMKVGDYVLVRGSEITVRAIGVVRGDYEFRKDSFEHHHVRRVEWLDTRERDIRSMNGGRRLARKAVYELKDVSASEVVGLISEEGRNETPYVLVIDEINRGNISRIFGELITLLEPDKRLGAENELLVRLPYSGSNFSVPKNLYVIGTMNSTDRSIALMDSALRRRFRFEEVKPDSAVIGSVLKRRCAALSDGLKEEQIETVCLAFDRLNARIRALLDPDHQVGHGYFLEAVSEKTLTEVLYEKVLPLLREYFYGDHERLSRLLGSYGGTESGGFVEVLSETYGAGFTQEEEDEAAWDFHVYDAGEITDALGRTFG